MTDTWGLSQWLSWLETAHPKPIDFGLERIREVYLRLFPNGLPFKVITVGGTNGKGSTVAALESIYRLLAVQVGSYTSPHLEVFNERIRINKQNSPDENILEAFDRVYANCREISLTYFEFSLLSALVVFEKQGIKLAILEVGLGGRLDAVNVVDTDLAVITNVDLDHTEYLGETRDAIAIEKAGILREGIPLVIGDPKPPPCLLERAETMHCKIYRQGLDFGYLTNETSPKTWSWFLNENKINKLPTPGIQLQNASTALMAAKAFAKVFPLKKSLVREAFSELLLRGRQEVWSLKPDVILDVAHNPQATEALAAMLSYQPSKKTYALFAICKDKDIAATLRPLLPYVSEWHLTPLPVPRGANPQAVSCLLNLYESKNHVYQSIKEAIETILSKIKPNERLIVFGSFYLLGPIYGMLRETEKVSEML